MDKDRAAWMRNLTWKRQSETSKCLRLSCWMYFPFIYIHNIKKTMYIPAPFISTELLEVTTHRLWKDSVSVWWGLGNIPARLIKITDQLLCNEKHNPVVFWTKPEPSGKLPTRELHGVANGARNNHESLFKVMICQVFMWVNRFCASVSRADARDGS